jgi:hypothetical protein
MEQAVTYHCVKYFRTEWIFFSAYMPSSNINSIGQSGMLEDDLVSDIEHSIGTIKADNGYLRVTGCKSNRDIGGATPKI